VGLTVPAMKVFTFSEAGGHPANEDAFRVEPHPKDPDVLLVAVADGQGGRAGGAKAARLAVDTTIEVAGRMKSEDLGGHPFVWSDVLRQADEAARDDAEAGFTTLIGLMAYADVGVVTGASCGDSAVLVVGSEEPELWTEGQRKNPPVGSGEAEFKVFAGCLPHPFVVLVMTDGVWKYAGWEAVKEAARTLHGQELIDAIAARARLPRSGEFQDDFTLIVLESDG
jgi:serine phosphatase RsbU (regulator of sigma subunit)